MPRHYDPNGQQTEQIRLYVTEIFAEHHFVISTIDEILNAINQRANFERLMATSRSSQKPANQRRDLSSCLSTWKEKRHRVMCYDHACGEWFHLPGYLWAATRQEHRIWTPEQAIARLNGTRAKDDKLVRSVKNRQDWMAHLIQDLRDGKEFARPKLLQSGLFDYAA